MKEEKRLRREVFESDDYIQLPDKFEIHDWEIMQDFCLSLRKAEVREESLDLIRGRGAFASQYHRAVAGGSTLPIANCRLQIDRSG